MDNTNFVTKALEYYDQNRDNLRELFKSIYRLQLIPRADDLSYNQLLMYNQEGTLLYRVPCQTIGIYYNQTRTWLWAWAKVSDNKLDTEISRRLLNYAFDLDPTQYYFLKTELITSRFRITSPLQLDIHVAMASYLSKSPIVFPMVLYRAAEMTEVQENGKRVMKTRDELSGTEDPDSLYYTHIKNVPPGEYGDDYLIRFLILDFSKVNINEEKKDKLPSTLLSQSRMN